MASGRRLFGGLTGTRRFVNGMQSVHELMNGRGLFNLGVPATSDDDVIAPTIDGDAVAGTIEAYDYTSDAYYGRTLQLKVSADPGVATSVVDVRGYDWTGQPMVERFTTVNASTAIQYGKKAFYKVTSTKIVTAATNAITLKLGTYDFLGLPFAGDVEAAWEAGVRVPVYKNAEIVWFDRSAADAVAGISKWARPGYPGYVKTLLGIPDGGGSTNDPVITVELGGTAIVGLTVTIDTSDTAGLTVTDVPTTAGFNANNKFAANGLVEIVGAAAASAKGDRVGVELVPTQVIGPVKTDPGTAITGDPRGTYCGISLPNGVISYDVEILGDVYVNASGNGGLHGIAHYYA